MRRRGEKGQLSDVRNENEEFSFRCFYNNQLIEIYCDPIKIENEFLNIPDVTDEILNNIFKFLAHHEYGHSLFCESTKYLKSFYEKHITEITMNLRIFNLIFYLSNEFFADFQAKRINSTLPKFYFDKIFTKNFEDFLEVKRDLINYNDCMTESDLTSFFYSRILYLSNIFYAFDKWDNLLELCRETDNKSLLELVFVINKVYEKLIPKTSNLKIYWESLLTLTVLLKEIDYFKLICNDNLNNKIKVELDDFLNSL